MEHEPAVLSRAERLGREVAELFGDHAPRLFSDLLQSRVLAMALPPGAQSRARLEWECFALYACVRGIVAGADFGGATAQAIDAFHAAAVPARMTAADDVPAAELSLRVSERYDDYADVGKAGGASGAATVTDRLGAAAARHMLGAEPSAELAELVGGLHETLAEVVADAVRAARAPAPEREER